MSLSIIITFIPLVVAVIVSPLSENTSILAWLAGGLTLIFGFFILPQVGVHRIMASEKTRRLTSFTHYLEEAMERSLQDPSSENMQRLKELFELQAHLVGMNDWPFNTNTVWQLITALLIPIALTVLQIFF
jgi:flagellar motor component MotA